MMLRIVIFALVLRLTNAEPGSRDEEYENAVTASSRRVQSNQGLASSESALCDICGLCFNNLSFHMSVHNLQKPFSCSQCDKQFKHASSLRIHQRIHSGEKLCNCSECGKQFTCASMLQRHQQTHADTKSFLCAECGRQFAYSYTLLAHQRTHTGEKPFRCSQCEKQFTCASSLQAHQHMHSAKKLHDCPICGKQFTRPDTLRKHRRMHTNVKPFRCAECGKQFAYAHRLHSHQRTHTGEKPFICPDCKKRFARAGNLQAHQRTHAGVKPFRCTECGKQFSRSYNLLRHQRMHTVFLECGMRFELADCLRDHRLKGHAIWVNSTGSSPFLCTENSTAVLESSSLFQTILQSPLESSSAVERENRAVFSYPLIVESALENLTNIESFVQMKNLTVMKKPSFLPPILESLANGTSSAQMEISTETKDPFLLQSVSKNPADSPLLIQTDSLTELEREFVLHVENPVCEPSLPEDSMVKSLVDHVQNPTIFGNTFVFENPVPNPSLGDAMLEKLVGNSFLTRTDTHTVPQTSLENALSVQMQEHILTNADGSVQLPYGDSDVAPSSTYMECPVCFDRFGGWESLKDHLLKSSCSLYPLDWLSYLESGNNDDFAK